ncbi:Rapamycin-insensitive companion of mTOR, N-term family protein [Candida albicans]|uniref:Rapamycin-insensitive companion of mTOR, N-term family protein n=1 Tax=Candida albicans TaxID=5476 RepID=A0A8H6BU05_CANAX|nr:Rapamycin-insensitive companion of mTOR, N-term family protein [Candida albicans]
MSHVDLPLSSSSSIKQRSETRKLQSRPPRPDIKRARSATMSMLQDNTSLHSIQNTESPTWLLSDLLSNLSVFKDKNEYSIVTKANDLVMLFQQHPNLKHDVQIKAVLPRIQFMLNHTTSEVRSSCYRIIRYLIVNYESLMILVQQKLLIYIIISLSNTRNVSLIEMEQSLKLIREFLTVDKGSDLLSVGVIKTLITIVEENGDSKSIPESFKNACLETICEITLLNPELICHSGGFKLIINSILDKPVEIGSTCLMIVLKLLDFENSRKFVRNGFDLDSLISIYSNLSDHDDETNLDNNSTRIRKTSNYKLQKISFLISTLLKNLMG